MTETRQLTRKQGSVLVFLCVITYFASYLTRTNYTAIIVELVSKGVATLSGAAVVTTVAFVTYGVGQIVSGFVGDRVSPRWLIFSGFLLTVSMNCLMPFLTPGAMAVAWGVNGVAHAFMWPPMVKIMTAALSAEQYSRAVPLISMGSAAATIVVYLFAPVILSCLDWRYVFFVFAGITLLIAFLWIGGTGVLLRGVDMQLGGKKHPSLPRVSVTEKQQQAVRWLTRLLPVIMLSIAVQGVLRDGIATWMPSLMAESFRMEAKNSILTAVVLPIFQVLTNLAAYTVLKFFRQRVFVALTAYFALMTGLLAVLYFFAMDTLWLSLGLIALASGVAHSINLLQTAYIPKYFMAAGSVSTVSGMLNFSTYIGSAASTYGFALIAEHFGWNATVLSWVLFALLGTALCGLLYRLTAKHLD